MQRIENICTIAICDGEYKLVLGIGRKNGEVEVIIINKLTQEGKEKEESLREFIEVFNLEKKVAYI